MNKWIRKAAIGCVLSLGLVAVAQAGDMSSYFGNTILVKGAHGTVKVYMNQDGTYATDADGQVTKGTWTDDGAKTCMTQTAPTAAAGTCHPSEIHKVGESWTIPGPGTAMLVPGHQ